MSDDSDGQRQCRRGRVTGDVELDAAMALADMAGVGPAAGEPAGAQRGTPPPPPVPSQGAAAAEDEEELASTRLSLELGKVGIQSSSSPCSSSSSAAGHPQQQQHHHHHHHHHAQQQHLAAATGYGPRPRHMLTEAEKEAKRLRRVLANRESARQTILRRQAIRDELARKVADLSSQNESMKKEKDMVMQEYLSLKESNKQLKEQAHHHHHPPPPLSLSLVEFSLVQVARTTAKKAPPAVTAAAMPVHAAAAPGVQQAAEASATASPPATPPQPGFLYTPASAAAVPVPYVWGSWPPGPGAGSYDPHHPHAQHGSPPAQAAAALCLPPCAWYYPVVADPRGSPSAAYPAAAAAAFQDPARGANNAEPAGSGGASAEEDTDDHPCSLTLALDVVDKRSAPVAAGAAQGQGGGGDRDKVATAAEARKRRKEQTKLKHMHAAGRPGGGEQW
ncbi:hypothetical protein U9M48_005176 [Paspalum notatum var. saurae]|uniref:BZIP domain-containing protein n=1 Tax=Paspalum notatum var. saurae TaxID=547442 RepID=A0AAQ3SFB3_PASNO